MPWLKHLGQPNPFAHFDEGGGDDGTKGSRDGGVPSAPPFDTNEGSSCVFIGGRKSKRRKPKRRKTKRRKSKRRKSKRRKTKRRRKN